MFYKQTKNRNETGSNLTLGKRLTVLSKRLARKRCCDTTPEELPGTQSSHYLDFALFKEMLHLLPKIEGFGGIPRLEVYQKKNEYAQRRRLRRINSLLKVKLSRLECLYQPPEIQSSLPKFKL